MKQKKEDENSNWPAKSVKLLISSSSAPSAILLYIIIITRPSKASRAKRTYKAKGRKVLSLIFSIRWCGTPLHGVCWRILVHYIYTFLWFWCRRAACQGLISTPFYTFHMYIYIQIARDIPFDNKRATKKERNETNPADRPSAYVHFPFVSPLWSHWYILYTLYYVVFVRLYTNKWIICYIVTYTCK